MSSGAPDARTSLAAPVRAVLLDAMGTLIELEPPAPRLSAELERRFGLSVPVEAAHRAIAAEIAYYREHLDEGRDEPGLADLRGRCAAVAFAELARLTGMPPPGDQAAMTDALLAALRFRAFADAAPALRDLRARGLSLVVVSNWDASLPGVLGSLGLAERLDGILTSAQAGVRKPSPGIFTRALELAGVKAEQALHVGDSLEEDVAGARAAGVQPILIVRRGTAPQGVRSVAGLGEILDLVDRQ